MQCCAEVLDILAFTSELLPCLQTRLVFEAGQLKGAILMSFPDRIHALQKSTYGAPSGVDRPLDDAAWAQVPFPAVCCTGVPCKHCRTAAARGRA